MRVGVIAGFAAVVAATSAALAMTSVALGTTSVVAMALAVVSSHPALKADTSMHPGLPTWVEGVDPAVENRLFFATYGVLPSHNVLKVYAFSAGGYESAAVRFSGRVPHESRDLTVDELAREAVVLIRTTFDDFPQIQHVDIWATVPVAQSQATSVENTVFSVSADRSVYERIPEHADMTDESFLGAFGRVWIAPQVPR